MGAKINYDVDPRLIQQCGLYQHVVPLDMKGCICHLTKWQIHPFISKGTIYFEYAFQTLNLISGWLKSKLQYAISRLINQTLSSVKLQLMTRRISMSRLHLVSNIKREEKPLNSASSDHSLIMTTKVELSYSYGVPQGPYLDHCYFTLILIPTPAKDILIVGPAS